MLCSNSMTDKSHTIVHWAITIKIIASKPLQVTKEWMQIKGSKMKHVGLSHNLKIQMLCATIQINYPILDNPTRCVYNHINKL